MDITQDGNYYFAIRYTSISGTCYLCLNSVEVTEGLNVGAPRAIEDLAVIPDYEGALKAEIRFTSPSKNMIDEALTSNLSKIEIYRDGELINTLNNVACGQQQSFMDENVEAGYHTYTVTPYALTKGESSQARAYIGAPVPMGPTAGSVAETAEGKVKIAWTAPVKDVDGLDLNQNLVSYTVTLVPTDDSEPVVVAENLKTTEYEYQAVEAGKQRFVGYRINAVTAGGMSEGYADTDFIPVGTPYNTPITEGFDNGTLKYEFLSEGLGGYYSSWYVYNDESMPNLVDQDGTKGVIGLYSLGTAQSRLMTAKINVGGTNPVFSVWYRAVEGSNNTFSFEIKEIGDENFTTLYTGNLNNPDVPNDWAKAAVSLRNYIGKTVQVAINGNVVNNSYMFFDNMRIADQYAVNMRANELVAPLTMMADETSPLRVVVLNMGDNDMAEGDYTVDLYCNDVKVQTLDGPAVISDAKANIVFNVLHTVDAEDIEYVYKAVINAAGDGDTSDNTTNEATVTLKKTILPAVTNLTAVRGDDGAIVLDWSAPALPTPAPIEEVTEDFEGYPSFAKSDIGDWKLLDGDGLNFGGFNETLPGIDGPLSYFVMDNEGFYDPYNFLAAHSGTKFLASGYVNGASDDWLISPQVSQSSHALTFYARSSDSEYPESFEVLYSLDSRETTDFRSIRKYTDISNSWTKYSVTLPEGTKYFAIRCISNDQFLFFVDDITYTPMDPEREDLVIKGYQLYRDGQLLPTGLLLAPGYTDRSAPRGTTVEYTVKTVYVQGNSMMSNAASVKTAGAESLDASGVRVYAETGNVVVEGAAGAAISVATADGKVIANVEATPRTVIPAPAGVVIVTVDGRPHKLIVR